MSLYVFEYVPIMIVAFHTAFMVASWFAAWIPTAQLSTAQLISLEFLRKWATQSNVACFTKFWHFWRYFFGIFWTNLSGSQMFSTLLQLIFWPTCRPQHWSKFFFNHFPAFPILPIFWTSSDFKLFHLASPSYLDCATIRSKFAFSSSKACKRLRMASTSPSPPPPSNSPAYAKLAKACQGPFIVGHWDTFWIIEFYENSWIFNGHSRILNWRYLPYIRPM